MATVVEHKKFICVCFDGTNNNKWWQYTIYDDDTALTEWGRVGTKSGEMTVHKSKALAKMREKTRPNNKPDKLYTEVKVAEGTTQATVGQVQASKLKDIAQKQIDIKDPKLKELVDFLVKENVHNIVAASGGSITYDTSSAQFKTPLGVIMPEQIAEARRLLDDMSVHIIANDYSNRQLSRDLQEYLRRVPHAVGMSKISPELILPNPQALQKENSLLDGIQASFNDIQAGVVAKGKKPTTKTPKLFDVTLDVVRDKAILARIRKYFNDTKLNSHVTSGYKVKKVYEVKIGSMHTAYKKVGLPIGNVMELWHGTKCSNLLSILKVGLIIPRSSSGHVTGRMFGDGLYFSDQSTKALNYATNFWGRGGSTKRIFMFLSDVAMGKYYVPDGYTSRLPKSGYDSTFARARRSGVRNNEMIVYSTNQANLKYLIEFE